MTEKTKREKVENFLAAGYSLTAWEAIRMFNVTRLSAIIYELKKEGWPIRTHKLDNTKAVAYSIK